MEFVLKDDVPVLHAARLVSDMRALSIRQPYAELILRGEKTIEYRSRPTRLIGQRFYIYAAKKSGQRSVASGQKRTAAR